MAVKVRSDVITLIRVNDGAKGDSYWMSNEWIDVSASTYDQDTYYPVVGTSIPRDGAHRIKTSVQLNSKTKPNWSTHAAGFSVDLEIQTQASGWGTTHAVTYIILDDFLFTNTKESPVSFQQKIRGSTPVLYLRGGGRYHVTTTYKCTWSIKTEKYDTHSGPYGAEYVEPTKTRPNTDGVPIKGINGDSVSSIVEEYYLSTSNTSQTGGSWATTPQSYVSGRYYWTRSHIVYKKADGSTYSGYTTPVLANGLNSANSEAKNATTIANGKNKVMFSATANPSGTSGYSAGDIWFNKSTGGIWQFNGKKWNPHQVGTESIANGAITADKVAANAINAQKINVDTLSAISANLGNITAGDINGVTITGSTLKTHWAKVTVGDYADAVGAYYARVRLYKNQFLIESHQGHGNEVPTDDTLPDGVISLYGAASWDTDNIIIGYAAKSASGGITDDAINSILTNDEVDTDYLISKKMLGTMVYRVGTIYMSTENYSPAGFFGGTWEQIKDRFLLSAGNSYSAGSTGGQSNMHIKNSGAEASGYGLTPSSLSFTNRVMVTDGNYTSDSNLPPYLTVYMWKRIA